MNNDVLIKKMRRKERNRMSAALSRVRRRQLLDDVTAQLAEARETIRQLTQPTTDVYVEPVAKQGANTSVTQGVKTTQTAKPEVTNATQLAQARETIQSLRAQNVALQQRVLLLEAEQVYSAVVAAPISAMSFCDVSYDDSGGDPALNSMPFFES